MSEEVGTEPTHRDVRAYLIEELHRDLVGPHTPDEQFRDRPTVKYLTGVLYPAQMLVSPEEDDEGAEASVQDDELDIGTLMASAFYPSSAGFTFQVDKGNQLVLKAEAARYIPKYGDDEYATWMREQLDLPEVTIELNKPEVFRKKLIRGLELFVRVRDRASHFLITASLVNNHEVPEEHNRPDELCFFQPELGVESAQEGDAVFIAREGLPQSHHDEERQLNRLLYRHAKAFAVGHGCSVRWQVFEGEARASAIWMDVMPFLEVPQITPDVEVDLEALVMRFLVESDESELFGALKQIPERYLQWISIQESLLSELPADLLDVGKINLKQCRDVASRIDKGIDLLRDQSDVLEAFRLANRAMLEQRARSVWISALEDDRTDAPVLDESHRWRLFQLAFILITISSIANQDSPQTDIVDLLWFPTGGGKTEAYLGLTAFTIFLRRSRESQKGQSAGVTVLMRYTLRLLTIQQFQRAATLILACETIRRERDTEFGTTEIALGLWVGAGATPNWLREARASLKKHKNNEDVFERDPCQVLYCPWCGEKIRIRDYSVTTKLEIKCPSEVCDFHEGLPLYVVDEDIYRHQPSMLIGTVDKFARLPWVGESASLFGNSQPRHQPPELIIQDELHLISGPLGTMVGLYETAIDALASEEGHRSKVIASTATIRRASHQSHSLFGKELTQFPPPGLDARDNFFSKEDPVSEKPGRIFLGVHAAGKSMKMALLTIYSHLLQKIYSHKSSTRLRDPYWTLVGYFNSLRELGGARRLVDDDVRERIKGISSELGDERRMLDAVRELTSRVPSPDIPDILKYLEKRAEEGGALDVLLASNMISVGVDVDRLSLMVVNGQPKTTSEYIQSTSRVGRMFPGLVVTLYKATRPRDRSHYENFTAYHQTLYSQVEPTSVTPFSSRARDRGLPGIFITLVRHLLPGMRANDRAGEFDPDRPEVQEVIDIIRDRVESIDPDELDNTMEQLNEIVERWKRLALADKLLYTKGYKKEDKHLPFLMISAEEGEQSDFYGFKMLNSLRSVEAETNLMFLIED